MDLIAEGRVGGVGEEVSCLGYIRKREERQGMERMPPPHPTKVPGARQEPALAL